MVCTFVSIIKPSETLVAVDRNVYWSSNLLSYRIRFVPVREPVSVPLEIHVAARAT